jgi:hypothetical protein
MRTWKIRIVPSTDELTINAELISDSLFEVCSLFGYSYRNVYISTGVQTTLYIVNLQSTCLAVYITRGMPNITIWIQLKLLETRIYLSEVGFIG